MQSSSRSDVTQQQTSQRRSLLDTCDHLMLVEDVRKLLGSMGALWSCNTVSRLKQVSVKTGVTIYNTYTVTGKFVHAK